MARGTQAEPAPEEPQPGEVEGEVTAIEDGQLLDIITGDQVKDTPKERVRQRIARALFREYGIPIDCMEGDFTVPVGGEGQRRRRIKVDIAIFRTPRVANTNRDLDDLVRVVSCQPEPKAKGKNTVTKLRDHEAAQSDLNDVKCAMEAAARCEWGLWTNNLDFFFLRKDTKSSRFEVRFNPVGDWEPWDSAVATRDIDSTSRMRRADPDMLRVAFRRCHNFIHGNQGMSKDKAFWQFLYLIFCKMHDEQRSNGHRRFWAAPSEQFEAAGQQAIRDRVLPLFAEVKKKYHGTGIFRDSDEITLNAKALSFMVSELSRYDLSRTDVDAKGAAYQEIVGSNLKGDRGQFFTPRGAIKLMVQMLDPKPHERVLDPACGTGGFLVATLGYVYDELRAAAKVQRGETETPEGLSVTKQYREFAAKRLFGCDFDEDLVKATQMNVLMASNETGHVYHLDSLEFPQGGSDGVETARKDIRLGTIDVLFTNPPFGANIPTDEQTRKRYDLAAIWEPTDDRHFRNTGRIQSNVPPEVLFIERCLEWLKPGGRMAIVLPDGILGNPGDEYIRAWIMKQAWILASVDLPVESFVVEANVGVLTSLLFLKKKTDEEKLAEGRDGSKDYKVFMAVAEKVGVDRRGNVLYKRKPDGEEEIEVRGEPETLEIEGKKVTRTIRRPHKIVDDDLPQIAQAYRDFRKINTEPGL